MANTGRVEIETDRLKRDIDSLREHLNKMKKKGQEMMTGIESLSSMWEGEAKNTFLAQFKADYRTLQNMEKVIEDLISDLEYAREKYNKCESDVNSTINSIRV